MSKTTWKDLKTIAQGKLFETTFEDGGIVYHFHPTRVQAKSAVVVDIGKHYGRDMAFYALEEINDVIKKYQLTAAHKIGFKVATRGSGRPGIELWDSNVELANFLWVCESRYSPSDKTDVVRTDKQLENVEYMSKIWRPR